MTLLQSVNLILITVTNYSFHCWCALNNKKIKQMVSLGETLLIITMKHLQPSIIIQSATDQKQLVLPSDVVSGCGCIRRACRLGFPRENQAILDQTVLEICDSISL